MQHGKLFNGQLFFFSLDYCQDFQFHYNTIEYINLKDLMSGINSAPALHSILIIIIILIFTQGYIY